MVALYQLPAASQIVGVAMLMLLSSFLAYVVAVLGLVAFRQLPLGLKYVSYGGAGQQWRQGYWYVADPDQLTDIRAQSSGGWGGRPGGCSRASTALRHAALRGLPSCAACGGCCRASNSGPRCQRGAPS
jgi:hypothetical protein